MLLLMQSLALSVGRFRDLGGRVQNEERSWNKKEKGESEKRERKGSINEEEREEIRRIKGEEKRRKERR